LGHDEQEVWDLERLEANVTTANCTLYINHSTTVLDGIVIGITELESHCRHLKWIKQIFVFTDGDTAINPDEDGSILAKARDYGVKINVM
jgi:hypothetical protein